MSNISFPKAVLDGYQEVLSEGSSTNWALFGYDKTSNDLKVNGSGDGGLEELAEEWDDTKIQYAFCRVVEPISKLPKFVLMSWCGDGVPVSRKGMLNSHLHDVAKYFKGFHVQINARSEDDIAPELVMKKVETGSGAKYGIHQEKPTRAFDHVEPVGSVYQPVRTNPTSLSNTTNVTAYKPTSASAPTPPPVTTTPAYRNPAAEIEQLRRQHQESSPVPSSSPAYRNPAAEIEQLRRQHQDREDSTPVASTTEPAYRNPAAEIEQLRRQHQESAPAPPAAPRPSAVEREREERERREREDRARREDEERQREREAAERRRRAEEDEARRRTEEEARAASLAARAVPAPPPAPPAPVVVEGQLTAIALYAYEAVEENEIDFEENEIITGIEQLDEGWWQGVNAKGRMGLFPANYVELRQSGAGAEAKEEIVEEPVAAAAPTGGDDLHEAIALYDYEAAEENEVSFAAGDLITDVIFVSEEWWQGKVNGVEGLFPGNYVELKQ
ncbi:hypothetical protein HDU97_003401 [Phlyctochytrium planicorne]|nr:hypothetical protein HDU97_003401 [Phlyctochytrium planicorne]